MTGIIKRQLLTVLAVAILLAGPSLQSYAGKVQLTRRTGQLGRMVPVMDAIAGFQERVKQNPDNVANRLILGRLYLRLARERTDHGAYVLAEKTFRKALEIDPHAISVRTYLAKALQAQHQFTEALELAEDIVATHPQNTTAVSIVFDCQLESGRYSKAEQSLRTLVAEAGNIPAVMARQARLAELQGRPDDATGLLKSAFEIAQEQGAQDVSWYAFRLATVLESQGEIDEAITHYKTALKHEPNMEVATVSLARLLTVRKQYDLAEQLYREVLDQRPSATAYTGLADLKTISGDKAAAEKLLDQAEAAFGREQGPAADSHQRQVSRFHSDYRRDVAKALMLARQDLKIRADIYAYDTAAWALHQNGRSKAALDMMRQAMKLNTQDAVLFYHSGLIHAACGEGDRAADDLRKALEINQHFDVRHAVAARQKLTELQDRSKL